MFYVMNLIYSAILKRDIRYFGSLPMIFALPFLASIWIFFDTGETVVVLYMVIYVVLGGATMLICMVFRKRRGDRI